MLDLLVTSSNFLFFSLSVWISFLSVLFWFPYLCLFMLPLQWFSQYLSLSLFVESKNFSSIFNFQELFLIPQSFLFFSPSLTLVIQQGERDSSLLLFLSPDFSHWTLWVTDHKDNGPLVEFVKSRLHLCWPIQTAVGDIMDHWKFYHCVTAHGPPGTSRYIWVQVVNGKGTDYWIKIGRWCGHGRKARILISGVELLVPWQVQGWGWALWPLNPAPHLGKYPHGPLESSGSSSWMNCMRLVIPSTYAVLTLSNSVMSDSLRPHGL